jgi:hypothetical protein
LPCGAIGSVAFFTPGTVPLGAGFALFFVVSRASGGDLFSLIDQTEKPPDGAEVRTRGQSRQGKEKSGRISHRMQSAGSQSRSAKN